MEELAAHKVDIVKIWVDTREGKYKKLTPELYGAVIDEAHKRGLRVTAHIFELEDAKGLIRARIDASRTACATGISTTRWWPCSSSVPPSSSHRTCRIGA